MDHARPANGRFITVLISAPVYIIRHDATVLLSRFSTVSRCGFGSLVAWVLIATNSKHGSLLYYIFRINVSRDFQNAWPSLPHAPGSSRAADQAAAPAIAMADMDDEFMSSGSALSPATRALYFALALLPILTAAYLFVSIFVVDVSRSLLTIAAGVAISAALMSTAYHNLACARIEGVRDGATAPTKASFKGTKGAKAEFDAALASFEKNISSAALFYSLFYNNAMFVVLTPFVGCYIFADKVSGDLNLLLSASASAGLCMYNSISAVKAMTSTD
jgi:hypothetical protein